MGLKKINDLEKAVVFLLNLDGWDLEWCGEGYSRYDRYANTSKKVLPRYYNVDKETTFKRCVLA